ncbi:hypothetical protein EJ04DRAFT_86480 [Polyplosphaeria fusca]|uniref:Uncharacterized protein n=1 Tax=Polyplosphaeria fusca TaxID=682080 RepID=A0A9P4R670_9PLEO|nr:hypothetical protein EJ04DRAFT_86480 [Polyplosphaeria fusca]
MCDARDGYGPGRLGAAVRLHRAATLMMVPVDLLIIGTILVRLLLACKIRSFGAWGCGVHMAAYDRKARSKIRSTFQRRVRDATEMQSFEDAV